MKNYPNQAVSFTRVRSTLATIDAVSASGQDALDDGVLGYELARRGLYTFRHLDPATATAAQIAARIAVEQQKPSGTQGARTNAREMRRTLRTMGWVDGAGAVTAEGTAVLASAPGSLDERALLAQGLMNISVTDNAGNTSHPVRVMLRLLDHRPSHRRDGLELALEALDDTDAEFARVRQLYDLAGPARQAALGISDHQRNNARKIFPALAKTAGLVVEDGAGYLSLSPDGSAVLGLPPAQTAQQIRARARRQASTGRVVTATTVAQRGGGAPTGAAPRTPEQQERSKALLAERTDRHQELVKRMAALFTGAGKLYEDPFSYDLLWVPDDPTLPIVLMEMKTINGDEDNQARAAVGQLSYYHFFEVSPNWPDRGVVEIAVVDTTIAAELVRYLTSEDIAVIAYPVAGPPVALNDAGAALLDEWLP